MAGESFFQNPFIFESPFIADFVPRSPSLATSVPTLM